MTDTSSGRPSFFKFIPVCIFLGAFLLSAATAGDYGVVWDEPPYFQSSDLHLGWLAGFAYDLLHGQPAKSLDDKRLEQGWHWDPYHVPHPPFSRIVSGITHELSPHWIDKFTSYRLGPALFFSLLVLVMYIWVTEVFGPAAGLFAALSIVLMPNLFGFSHIAVTDMPLAAMWFLTAYAFWKGLESWKWSAALGLIWGLALATKFPALLIPIPLLLWAHLFRRNAYANNVIAMFFVSPLVMIASQPYLWHQPFLRILDFLYEGVSRGYRPETNYPIFFLGREYLSNQLPRYYPFFITGVTTPETFLILALVGIAYAFRNTAQQKLLMLFLFNALFILLIGMLPGAVLHDGMRQMLSSCAFVAGLAAAGFFVIAKAAGEWMLRIKSLASLQRVDTEAAFAFAVLALFPPAFDLLLYHPFELSYYNRFIGGLPGAYDRGMEATYFLEAITPEFLEYLNNQLPPNARLNGLASNFMLVYYQKEGKLRRDIKVTATEPFEYFVVINRRSVIASIPDSERRFIISGTPLDSVSLAGVPLVYFYRLKN